MNYIHLSISQPRACRTPLSAKSTRRHVPLSNTCPLLASWGPWTRTRAEGGVKTFPGTLVCPTRSYAHSFLHGRLLTTSSGSSSGGPPANKTNTTPPQSLGTTLGTMPPFLCSGPFTNVTSFRSHSIPKSRWYYPCFTRRGTEVQKAEATCRRSPS